MWVLMALFASIVPWVVQVPLAQADDCTDCHTMTERAFVHEAAVADCTLCHVTHEQEAKNPNRLIKDINSLCLDCHDARALGIQQGRGHIITNHPLQGPRDPLYPDKPLSCASCHNPHSSDQEKLFRYDFRRKVTPYNGQSCAVCHWEVAIGKKPPLPPWSAPEQRP